MVSVVVPSGVDVPADGRLLAGRYRLGRVLGSGGMSVVHHAWDEHLGREVAVKLYTASSDPVARLRFQEEARTLAALSDPGLVAVFDAGTDCDQPFLVLQLITGRTLREVLGEGSLPPDEVRELGARLAGTLASVHAGGVIHRDVKPANVLLDEQSQPYLADFGISVLLHGSRVTATGQFVGTAGYLAPEQVLGADATTAVDVYALGLVLLECLTGRPEYSGTDLEAAIARLRRAPAVPDWVPADLAAAIRSMTARNPSQRPTAQRCAGLLREPSLLEETSNFPALLRPISVGEGRRRRFALLAGAGAAAVAALGWALIGIAEPSSPTRVTTVGPAAAPLSAPVNAPAPPVVIEVVTVVSTTVVTVPAPAPAPAGAPQQAAQPGGQDALVKERPSDGRSGGDRGEGSGGKSDTKDGGKDGKGSGD